MTITPTLPIIAAYTTGRGSHPETAIKVAKGSDWTRNFRVFDGARIALSADAATGATSLTLAPDHPAIATGDKIQFGENIIVTTSGASAVGATSLSVTALTGPLKAKAIGRRIVKDLSTYDLEFRVMTNRGDSTAVLEIQGTSDDDTSDPNSPYVDVGLVTGDEANFTSVDAGTYFWALWDATEGSEKPLAQGPFILEEAGYVA